MKAQQIALLILIILISNACSNKNPLDEYMVNSWQTSYIKIEMPTHNNSDSLYVYEDRFEKTPTTIAQSRYFKDGTFLAWYVNPNGKKESESEGKWQVRGDSLTVSYIYNDEKVEVSYHIKKTSNGFIGTSIDDWDKDGEKDDILVMETKSIKLSKE